LLFLGSVCQFFYFTKLKKENPGPLPMCKELVIYHNAGEGYRNLSQIFCLNRGHRLAPKVPQKVT